MPPVGDAPLDAVELAIVRALVASITRKILAEATATVRPVCSDAKSSPSTDDEVRRAT